MNMLKKLSSFSLVLGVALSQANASLLAFNPNGNYTKDALFKGTLANEAQCNSLKNAVWVSNAFGSECVVYFPANLKQTNKDVVVYMNGDLGTSNADFDSSFLTDSNEKKAKEVQYISNRIGHPFIQIGRLGMGASSGNHGEIRRTKAEVEIINDALTKIKAKYNIQNFTLTGHSGGGHTVAGVINKRSDVKCAVYGASPLMPALMELASPNKEINPKYYEPISDALGAKANKQLRSFVISDTRDYGGWRWKPMVTYVKEARKLGLKVEVLALKVNDGLRHNTVSHVQYVGGWCASNVPTVQLIKHTYQTFSY